MGRSSNVWKHRIGSIHSQTEPTDSDELEEELNALRSINEDIQMVNRVTMWPPWPLSLLDRRRDASTNQTSTSTDSTSSLSAYPSAAILFFSYVKQRARIGLRQLQEVGSSLWFHLPPAVPPILLLSSLPQKVRVEIATETGSELVTKRVIPLFSNAFARGIVLTGCSFAVISWAHQEINRKRSLTPLPLALPYQQSVSRVFLPPFLPEVVKETGEVLTTETNDLTSSGVSEDGSSPFSPMLRKHLSFLYENTNIIAKTTTDSMNIFKEWKRARQTRRREAAKVRRLQVFEELRALQSLKRKSIKQNKRANQEETSSLDTQGEGALGYALVTGASQGIGRALAVELARWEIPLILVARDLDRLTSLAYDLEACYGVKCCVLQADLSEVDAAERIYEATKTAGLKVDVLVNNAGMGYEGLATEISTELAEKMIMVNTLTYAKLSKLYGQDMIDNQRGRILMVSSMAGLTSSSPNMALYGATKAFERSLALSMAKELEPHGVGVTCLLPGPVTSTQFRSRSGTDRALCWRIPFYPRPAETVAHQGIMSLLDGDTQNVPGWQNRIFVQMVRPIIPQRLETMCVHAAWSPLRLPRIRDLWKSKTNVARGKPTNTSFDENDSGAISSPSTTTTSPADLKPRYRHQNPPKLLELPSTREPESSPLPQDTSILGVLEGSQACEESESPPAILSNGERAADAKVSDPFELPSNEAPAGEQSRNATTPAKVVDGDEGDHLSGSSQKEDTQQESPVEDTSEKPPKKEIAATTSSKTYSTHQSSTFNDEGNLSPDLGPMSLLESQAFTKQSRRRKQSERVNDILEV